jgi:predicted metalloprotease with PDZ domain
MSNGIMHEVAMSGKADYDSVVIQKDFKAITDECTKIFGSNPLDRYVFIILNTPSGGGGLEHSNSTVLQVSADTYRDSSKYKGLLSLAAHEYFHLWLVKRIRDAKLGPFDYDNEVYTTQLWFYEGFTSFYDDYIVYRTGRFSEQEYLDVVKGNIGAVVNTPGINYQSLSESSFDAWIKFYRRHENSNNSTVSYYTKGGVVAAMMNLDLLSRTDGTKSLDDLMKKLYSRFLQNGSGVTDEELMQSFSDIWGTDMSGFFNRFIYGTEAFPFEEYVLKSGMKLIRTDGLQKKPGYLGATFSEKGGQLIITGVRRNSPAWVDGLNVNDEILKADTASQTSIKAYLELKEPGNEVLFTVKRFGEEKILMVTLGEDPSASFAFESLPKPTSLQRKVRKGWLK